MKTQDMKCTDRRENGQEGTEIKNKNILYRPKEDGKN
jgi:hypothetical protein